LELQGLNGICLALTHAIAESETNVQLLFVTGDVCESNPSAALDQAACHLFGRIRRQRVSSLFLPEGTIERHH
jgi:hypothetical protein